MRRSNSPANRKQPSHPQLASLSCKCKFHALKMELLGGYDPTNGQLYQQHSQKWHPSGETRHRRIMGGSGPHLIHDFLGPSKPKTQMASRLLHQFSHRSLQSVPILYNGPPLPPSKLPLPMGMWTPSNAWFLGTTQVLNQNGIWISSAVFAGLTTMADRQTNRPCYSVCNKRLHLCTQYYFQKHHFGPMNTS